MDCFHPDGLQCPRCGASVADAYVHRQTPTDGLSLSALSPDIQSVHWDGVTAVSPDPTAGGFTTAQGGERRAEHHLSRRVGRELPDGAAFAPPAASQRRERCNRMPPPDNVTESDELFVNARGKGGEHVDPAAPPRCRTNKQRGRGTHADDRPPVLGTVGRETGQVRLRVVQDTTGATVRDHAERFTPGEAIINIDEYHSHNGIARERDSVGHGRHEPS